MVVESYSENNMSASMIGRHLDRYWLGLASLDDLRTNTLESAAGMLVSQYAGSYATNSASHSVFPPHSRSANLSVPEALFRFSSPSGSAFCSRLFAINDLPLEGP